jgi:hypothetical protein
LKKLLNPIYKPQLTDLLLTMHWATRWRFRQISPMAWKQPH